MVSKEYQFPKITPEMHEEMAERYRTHNDRRCFKQKYHGAIGGNVSFDITPQALVTLLMLSAVVVLS